MAAWFPCLLNCTSCILSCLYVQHLVSMWRSDRRLPAVSRWLSHSPGAVVFIIIISCGSWPVSRRSMTARLTTGISSGCRGDQAAPRHWRLRLCCGAAAKGWRSHIEWRVCPSNHTSCRRQLLLLLLLSFCYCCRLLLCCFGCWLWKSLSPHVVVQYNKNSNGTLKNKRKKYNGNAMSIL